MANLLDHGYLNLVESWGSDERIIEAARMSTQKGFKGWGPIDCEVCWQIPAKMPTCKECKGMGKARGDEKLLRFLWEHKHHTPFEMAGLTIEVQAPIFVFREWHRHRTQSYNELSARYTELPDLMYRPSEDRLLASKQSTTNKQGSERADWDEYETSTIDFQIRTIQEGCMVVYEQLLEKGVAREIARIVLPVAQYSRMRASANLRNWLAFLTLRMDPAAQWEIRQYANALADIVAEKFPRTYELFKEGQDVRG